MPKNRYLLSNTSFRYEFISLDQIISSNTICISYEPVYYPVSARGMVEGNLSGHQHDLEVSR